MDFVDALVSLVKSGQCVEVTIKIKPPKADNSHGKPIAVASDNSGGIPTRKRKNITGR